MQQSFYLVKGDLTVFHQTASSLDNLTPSLHDAPTTSSYNAVSSHVVYMLYTLEAVEDKTSLHLTLPVVVIHTAGYIMLRA